MNGVRALLLDALGTLLRLQPPAPVLRWQLASRFGIEVTDAQATTAIAAEIAYYRDHLDEGRDVRMLAGLRRRCTQALRSALPHSPALAAVDDGGLEVALLASLEFKAFEDAEPALRAARKRGQRLVVVSNWDVSLHDVLKRVGLAQLLDAAVTSAETGSRKPDPEIFRHALRLAGVAPDEAVHVGDSLAEDVQGARAAGVEAVLIARDGVPAPAGVRTITSLHELGS